MQKIINKKSKNKTIWRLITDFREIEAAYYGENENAKNAIECFTYNIAGFIAKYAAAMKGIDEIIFTGGIGENQINVRKRILERLTFMGVNIDEEANNVKGEDRLISTKDSKVAAYIVPTDEELMIARETLRLTK